MSVLREFYAVPSRVSLVYRYLLHHPDQWEARDTLEAILSPSTLKAVKPDRPMLRGVLNECQRMGLLQADGDRVVLHPNLSPEARNPKIGERLLPLTLMELFVQANDENHDLLRAISWYLIQPVTEAPGDGISFKDAMDQQSVSGDYLGIGNQSHFDQFNDWACYLGFAWRHSQRDKEYLVPDPTACLRRLLPQVFETPGQRMTAAEVEARVADLCPVLEGGRFRREVEAQTGPREQRMVSTTTAHAWFRLEEEGLVEIERGGADAAVFLFPEGRQLVRCSALVWRGAAKEN